MTTTPEAPATTLTERVAEEIRALMGRRRTTGAALARKLGRSEAWISYRLSGKQTIDLHDLEAIAGALGVAPVDLLPRGDREAGTSTQWKTALADQGMRGTADRPTDNRPSDRGSAGHRSGPPNGSSVVRHSRHRGTPAAVAVSTRTAQGSSHE